MWRPFISSLVNNSYSDYRRKMDKIWSAKPVKPEQKPGKISIKTLFPNSDLVYEIEKRKKEFVLLQQKVVKQRKNIRENDQARVSLKTQKIFSEKRRSERARARIKKQQLLIRSMALKKPLNLNKTFDDRSSSLGQASKNNTKLKHRRTSSN